MVICDDKSKLKRIDPGKMFIKESQVKIKTLNAFIPFLSNKHIALIKIDIEGHEFEVFEGGKELITKYHVPFLMIEYETSFLEGHGTEVLEFLQFFENNGYKISLNDFFSKQYTSPSEIITNKNILNLFIVYEKFLE